MLNENIKTLRKAKGLSQEELAIKLNVVRQTVSKWEKALSVPDAGMLIKIAEALDTTVNVLLGDMAPEQDKQESIEAIAVKLELLNEQLAKRQERNRKIWRTVFILIGSLALIAFAKECLLIVELLQFKNMLGSSAVVIGGVDEATGIFVSNISFRRFSVIMTIVACIVAIVGIHRTRRK